MHIEKRKILLDALLIDKTNILLDYINFSNPIFLTTLDIKKSWVNHIRLYPQIPIKFYLHIPFCSRICSYCMYNTILLDSKKQIDDYIETTISYLENFRDAFSDTQLS
jgi:coproporphyrinogen III oxidase-like Fe-S oxidoreductase